MKLIASDGTIIYIDDTSADGVSILAGYDWTWSGGVLTVLGTKTSFTTVVDKQNFSTPQKFSSQITTAKGTNAVAAGDLVLTPTGNSFLITGSTRIDALTTSGWTTGSRVVLIFRDSPTVKHDTAGGAGTAPFLLDGSADLSAVTDTLLEVIYDGTYWQEIARKRP